MASGMWAFIILEAEKPCGRRPASSRILRALCSGGFGLLLGRPSSGKKLFVVSKSSQELLSRRCGVWKCCPHGDGRLRASAALGHKMGHPPVGFGSAGPTATSGFEQVPPLAAKWATPPSAGQKFPAKSPPALFIPGRDIKRLGCLICAVKPDGIISCGNPSYIILGGLRGPPKRNSEATRLGVFTLVLGGYLQGIWGYSGVFGGIRFHSGVVN